MKISYRAAAAAILLCVAGASGLSAQWSTELRAGPTVGNHSSTLAGLDIKPQLSWEARVANQISPLISVWAGYGRTSFGCEEGFCFGLDEPVTINGSHLAGGAEVAWSFLWGNAGLLYGSAEVDAGTQMSTVETESGIGFQGGFGVRFGLGPLELKPGVVFRRLPSNTASASYHATVVGFDIGLVYRLGF